jgi:hypothetical protein
MNLIYMNLTLSRRDLASRIIWALEVLVRSFVRSFTKFVENEVLKLIWATQRKKF